MRARRLVGLLGLLQARGRMTAQSSPPSSRCRSAPSCATSRPSAPPGIPVYAVRGCQGGFELLDGFSSDLPAAATGRLRPPARPAPSGRASGCRRAAAGSPRCSAARPAQDPPEARPRRRRAGGLGRGLGPDRLGRLAALDMLALGAEVEVIHPPELRARVRYPCRPGSRAARQPARRLSRAHQARSRPALRARRYWL